MVLIRLRRRTHRSDALARVNILLGLFLRQLARSGNLHAIRRRKRLLGRALAFHLRRAAEQFARPFAQWQSHSRLGPALTIPT
jgi:hypothetical protein